MISTNRHAITVTDDQVGRTADQPVKVGRFYLPVRGMGPTVNQTYGPRNIPAVASLFSHSAKRTV
jgi:hypothetical protein